MIAINENLRALNVKAPPQIPLLVGQNTLDFDLRGGFHPLPDSRADDEVHLVFRIAVVRVVAQIGRGEGGVRCDGLPDEPGQLDDFALVSKGILCNIGNGQPFYFRKVGGRPFHGAGPEGLNPNPSIVFNDVAHDGHRRSDGRHVAGPVPS